jgi:hypothetical protein
MYMPDFATSKTQSQANTNNCNNSTNCAITSPQTQGDGSASSPTSLQISNLKGTTGFSFFRKNI